MGLLKGRVALITGSSRGIGRAIALRMAQEGADVVINYVSNEEAAHEVMSRVTRMGPRAAALKADVSREEDVRSMIEKAVTMMGKLDIVVNNAQIHRGRLIHKLPLEEWDRVVHSGLYGAFHVCHVVVPYMVERKWGRIINMTSVVGLRGWPGDTAYGSAKAGLIGFTKSLAKELASKGITVNAVAPGFIRTDMTAELTEKSRGMMESVIPLGRPGEPEEVAEVVTFLATPRAAYITGSVYTVDGGMGM
jgi:3-oxoacyl-[acyl-carrier protein] reductase